MGNKRCRGQNCHILQCRKWVTELTRRMYQLFSDVGKIAITVCSCGSSECQLTVSQVLRIQICQGYGNYDRLIHHGHINWNYIYQLQAILLCNILLLSLAWQKICAILDQLSLNSSYSWRHCTLFRLATEDWCHTGLVLPLLIKRWQTSLLDFWQKKLLSAPWIKVKWTLRT